MPFPHDRPLHCRQGGRGAPEPPAPAQFHLTCAQDVVGGPACRCPPLSEQRLGFYIQLGVTELRGRLRQLAGPQVRRRDEPWVWALQAAEVWGRMVWGRRRTSPRRDTFLAVTALFRRAGDLPRALHAYNGMRKAGGPPRAPCRIPLPGCMSTPPPTSSPFPPLSLQPTQKTIMH